MGLLGTEIRDELYGTPEFLLCKVGVISNGLIYRE